MHRNQHLSSLDLSGNCFTVEFNNNIPVGGSRFSHQISTLRLSSCNITEFPFFLRNQTRLSLLDLSNNKVRGDIPNWIWQIGQTNLNLSHNLLTGVEEPANLSLSYLAILDLHSNMIEGSLPIPPFASVLDYSLNRFASTVPANVGHYLNFTCSLSLSGNKFTGEIPPSICDGPYLKVLDMSNNSLTGSIPACLTGIIPLVVLNLGRNQLQDTIPEGFIEGSNLRTLDLNSNRLTGPISKSLARCTMLQVLDLGNNNLTGTFPPWLENLPHLRVLVLCSNRFHGPLKPPKSQLGFHVLQIMDLSSNKFTGNLPAKFFRSLKATMIQGEESKLPRRHADFLRSGVLELSKLYYQDTVTMTWKGIEMNLVKILTIFTSIDLSDNRFYGSIPEELGNLNSLITLNLSWNRLTDSIPASLGNLSQLESMDLSQNRLSGHVPIELTNLNFLCVLNLSRNQLTGGIPHGGQFETFSNASFEGNSGLCGLPLSLQCETTPEVVEKPANGEDTEWQFIVAVAVGFVTGSWLAFGTLLFWSKGRRWFNGRVDPVLLLLLFPALARQRRGRRG